MFQQILFQNLSNDIDNYTLVGNLVLVTSAELVQSQTFSILCVSIMVTHLHRTSSCCQWRYLKQGLI